MGPKTLATTDWLIDESGFPVYPQSATVLPTIFSGMKQCRFSWLKFIKHPAY